MSICSLCETQITDTNVAVFPCSHRFHLTCVMNSFGQYATTCSTCKPTGALPDLGQDRTIAMQADICAKVEKRQTKSVTKPSFGMRLTHFLSPIAPTPHTFYDHMENNFDLSILKQAGLTVHDALQEHVTWRNLARRYTSQQLLDFGFKWEHMVQMGIQPRDLLAFNWTQQKHDLELDAAKLLKLRMTITELSSLRYTCHQLVELGFEWDTLARMGANVSTWAKFNFTLHDIKNYWTPTVSQWVSAGFYDKDKIQRAGWDMADIKEVLPRMTTRCSGRTLRLTF